MKILHIIPSISPVRGGPSKAVIDIVKSLINLEVKAEILTTNDHGINLLDVPLGQCIEYQQVPVWFFSRFSPPIHSIREFAFSASFTQWLWKNIKQYDLLHIHAIFSYPSTIAMAIARLRNVPYICRTLGQLDPWSLQQSYLRKKLYLEIIERSNLTSAQSLHLTSQQEQEGIEKLGLKTSSFILPHGISIPKIIPNADQKIREQFKIKAESKIILFMSRLHPKKGLDYLIPALAKLEHHNFSFIIAGTGSSEYESKINSLITQYNLNSQVFFSGFVTGEAKTLLLQGSDLFVLTSHSENFGIVVLEALAVGTPVLITPGVALSKLVKEEKIGYITELNTDSIADSLGYFLSHLQEAKIMGNQGRKIIQKKYNWEIIANQLVSQYQKIINNYQ